MCEAGQRCAHLGSTELVSGWRAFKILEIADVCDDLRAPLSKMERVDRRGLFPYYGASGIIDYVDAYRCDGEYVLISEDGENLKSRKTPIAFRANGRFWVNNHAHVVRGKKPHHNALLVYLFQNLDLNPYLTGAVQPKLSQENLVSIEVLLPTDENEQRGIAAVLSSLDDKIDLLHRQNKTLESMAETLFRQWFVEEAKEDWETGTLKDILSLIESGSRPKGGIDPNLREGVPSIGAENINGIAVYDFNKTKFVTEAFYKSMKRGIIKDFDVLVYKDGAYVGRKGMFGKGFPFEKCAVNEHVFILRSNERGGQLFLYFLLQPDELAQLNANSAQPGLNQEVMKSFEITIPPKKIIEDFECLIKPFIEKILTNGRQLRVLEKLRHNLLPKLMSGEVRVKYER